MANNKNKSLLNECIITATTINGDMIMAKNRDRTYKPTLQVVRELKDGVEYVYLEDIDTGWCEGMNSDGVGIINSTLSVKYDEDEFNIVNRNGVKTKDGEIIKLALSKNNMDTATKVILKNKLLGHTLISGHNGVYAIEMAKNKKPVASPMNIKDISVRTNHGIYIPNEGYTEGEKFLSTKTRKETAEEVLQTITDYNEIAKVLRKNRYEANSMLNMTRKTKTIFTTSQMVMNITQKVFVLYIIEEYVNQFMGIINNCPSDYKSKIDIIVYKVKPVERQIYADLSTN